MKRRSIHNSRHQNCVCCNGCTFFLFGWKRRNELTTKLFVDLFVSWDDSSAEYGRERCNKPCQPFHVRATANGEARKWDQVDQIARLSPLDLSLSISHLALFYLPSFLFGPFFSFFSSNYCGNDVHLMQPSDPRNQPPKKTTYNLSRTRTKPNKSCDESIMHPSRKQKCQKRILQLFRCHLLRIQFFLVLIFREITKMLSN